MLLMQMPSSPLPKDLQIPNWAKNIVKIAMWKVDLHDWSFDAHAWQYKDFFVAVCYAQPLKGRNESNSSMKNP